MIKLNWAISEQITIFNGALCASIKFRTQKLICYFTIKIFLTGSANFNLA